MNGAVSMDPQRFQVLSGPVTLVPVEPVDGVLEVKVAHEAVPVDFGHNGCGRYGEAPSVAPRDSLLCRGKRKPVRAVDEKEIGRDAKIADSHGHGPERGLQDVDPIDLRRLHHPDTHGGGAGQNILAPGFPFCGIELLGIHNPRKTDVAGQNDRRGHNGAGQRPAAHLIDSRHQLKTPAMEISLEGEHVHNRGFKGAGPH